jgi:hypothetical protein
VGYTEYKKVEDIITKHPSFFPQEIIYRSIPQEVKDLYEKEATALRNRIFPPVEMNIKPGEGISGWAQRQVPTPLKMFDLKESLYYIFEERPKKDREYQKGLKDIHNKHYKKYKLEFE